MTHRQLAAIMFSDIAGYTAIMQADETIGKKKALIYRQILEEKILQHEGQVINHYGDGSLSIFQSSIEATQCAKEIQEAFKQVDIPVRIGIHLGDINIEGNDVYGDGVNIASRVESIGIPGSVLFTERLFEDLRNHPEFQVRSLGKIHFKNDKNPRAIYALEIEGLELPTRTQLKQASGAKLMSPKFGAKSLIRVTAIILIIALGLFYLFQDDEPIRSKSSSLLVLPFDNYTGSDDLEYFVAGMHSALITDVGRISAMRVMSKTTANAYKQTDKPLSEIARELGINSVVESSVSCLGDDTVCVQVKLLSVYPEEEQIWVGDYREDKREILNLYHTISRQIADEIHVELTPDEERRFTVAKTIDPEAYDLYVKGQFYLDQVNPSSLESAMQYFNQAATIEPTWGAPYTGLANTIAYQNQMDIITPKEAIPKIREYLGTALKFDSISAEAYHTQAVIAVWTDWDWTKGERAFIKALDLNPNHALSRMFYAHLLTILRRTDEALQEANKAVELDPFRPLLLGLHGVVLMHADECEYALKQVQKALSIEPNHAFARAQLTDVYECLGRYDLAFKAWRDSHFEFWESFGVTDRFENAFYQYGWDAVIEEAIKINEEVFAPEGAMDVLSQAFRYLKAKKYDKAIAYFNQIYEYHDPNLPYISAPNIYAQFDQHPGYVALLGKMNLPVD